MSEQIHGACHAAMDAATAKYRVLLAAERAKQTANSLIGEELRYMVAPGVKRETYRKFELEELVAMCDWRAGR